MRASDLTVVIPTSGRWEVLGRTLDALAAQTAPPAETVVVVNGLDRPVPAAVQQRPRVRVIAKADEGPGPARNLAVATVGTPLILFLGDDTIPTSDLVARHLERHRAEPAPEVAVLGTVRWHPEVADNRLNRWLDWSGTQFDYAALDAAEATARSGASPGPRGGAGAPADALDAGFGRFYTANLSLKRSFWEPFDPAFRFGYEDIDLGYRLAQRGLVLRYEPLARAQHLHANTIAGLHRRFELVGTGERVMAAKHPWFVPFFHERFTRLGAGPRISPLWAGIHDRVPRRIERLWWPVHARAERWYYQEFADSFFTGWDRALDEEELAAYLGDAFERESLWRHSELVEAEAAASPDLDRFYRTSRAYLYDLTAFAMSGTKLPYHAVLRSLVPSGARVLDFGCGIGADGLRLLSRGYVVEFADFDNPSVAFLRWRLARRGLDAPVHDLDGALPDGFALAYAFDVLEHVSDPWALLARLEQSAALVLVNVLEPRPGDVSLHHELPVRAILRYARERGIVHHERLHGRSHLIAYRGVGARSSSGS
ncbi:glycosyltransferase [Conexibacter sp. DBS9H8]|uniref:glycosyltransferase n=1 Tax=Conexibacter sp. DBS9H8 TaxID=2937801 RepID=UPI00200D599B|nr:glycosyltransferase [Conexibacter sp. DBS9H8]